MANSYYQDQNLYYFLSILTVFILLIQNPILVIAQSNQFIPTDASNSHTTITVPTTTITTIFTILNNNDDNAYENNVENIYDDDDADDDDDDDDDEEDFNMDSSSRTVSQSKLNNSITTDLNDETQFNEYDDELNSYQDDGDDIKNNIFTNTIPISKYPIIDSNSPSTSRISIVSSHIWRTLFSRPVILVGIIGGICIGMTLSILLVMFIIYRMRKKDEGSYALEEGPRKSPTHAYSRVSSKEFYA